MIKKYRLCLTAILVFSVMGWFIHFLEAQDTGYQTSLFGGLSTSYWTHHSAVQTSTIRFIPRNAVKIAVINGDTANKIENILESQRLTLTAQLKSEKERTDTTLYFKTNTEAKKAHNFITLLDPVLKNTKGNVKVSDFGTFYLENQDNPYFASKHKDNPFVDYKTITEDSDIILWLGKNK